MTPPTITPSYDDADDDVPVKEIRTGPLEPVEDMDVTADTTAADETDVTRNLFHDDNDGKKEAGWCQPCEGCTIL
jgi:hypothetical protein